MQSDNIFPIEQSDMYKELMAEKLAIEQFRKEISIKEGQEVDMWRAEWLWWMDRQRSWRSNYRFNITGQKGI